MRIVQSVMLSATLALFLTTVVTGCMDMGLAAHPSESEPDEYWDTDTDLDTEDDWDEWSEEAGVPDWEEDWIEPEDSVELEDEPFNDEADDDEIGHVDADIQP